MLLMEFQVYDVRPVCSFDIHVPSVMTQKCAGNIQRCYVKHETQSRHSDIASSSMVVTLTILSGAFHYNRLYILRFWSA